MKLNVFCGAAIAGLALGFGAPSASAVTINVSDATPNGDSGSGTRNLSTDLGLVSAPPILTTMTYTVSGLDLTSVGGTASETIVFDIDFTSNKDTGSTAVLFNGFGNISVLGNNNTQVDGDESLTATLSVNGLTTFTGVVSVGFTELFAGGAESTESWTVTHDGGSINRNGTNAGTNSAIFAPSSFFTMSDVTGTVNVQRYNVQIDAVVPEPGSLALLSLGGLLIARRRRG